MKKIVLLLAFAMSLTNMFSQNKFESEVKINGEIGIDADKNFSFGAIFIAGYNITQNLRLGAGAGISYIDLFYEQKTLTKPEYRETAAYVPIFADAKYKFIKVGISPFVGTSVGYSVFIPYSDYAKENKLGIMVYPHFGVEFPMKKGAFLLEAGYKYQSRTNDNIRGANMDYSQSVLSVGYKF